MEEPRQIQIPEIKYVFRMKFAMQMQVLGHKLLKTSPSPTNPKYNVWIFEDDDTFDSDLHEIIQEDRRHGK